MVIGFCLEDFSLSCFVAHGVGTLQVYIMPANSMPVKPAANIWANMSLSKAFTIVVDVDFFGAPTVKERMSFLPLRAVPVEP